MSGIGSRLMFSILRFVLIVGVIFYYSPVRDRGEGSDALEAFFGQEKAATLAAASNIPMGKEAGQLETMWQALPESAKQAVVDKILTSSGLPPMAPKPSDTLRPEDRAPSTRLW